MTTHDIMTESSRSPNLSLSPEQQDLLRAALASNPKGSPGRSTIPKKAISQSPSTINITSNGNGSYTSPVQDAPDSGNLGFDGSPFLDHELDDGQFDWDDSTENLFGDLPGPDPHELEHHDKRKASTENDAQEEATGKRREGEEKVAKKPGRKPLTQEPTTKRKAQNRAAQRAFRERKERHLKDLETKVDELEKASEATNHENGRLRAQVEKLNIELKEYRKRISLNNTNSGYSPPLATQQARNFYHSNEFSFAFPKFGDIPSSFISNGSMVKTSSTASPTQPATSTSNQDFPVTQRSNSVGSPPPLGISDTSRSFSVPSSTQSPSEVPQTFDNSFTANNVTFGGNAFEDLADLFSPSVLESASRSDSIDYMSSRSVKSPSPVVRQESAGNIGGQSQMPRAQRNSSSSITASPISALSQNGLDSSTGTTPESFCDSPDNRKMSETMLNTISEETALQTKPEGSTTIPKVQGADINGIDWLAQQNGGQFDPVLFGDYRDPQDNVLNNAWGEYFNDAFPSPQDFNSPYNTGEVSELPPQQHNKRDLMKEVEAQQNGGVDFFGSQESPSQYLYCEKLRNRVEASEKFKSGEFDEEDLCSQLRAKARCSGTPAGKIIDSKHVDEILGPLPSDPKELLKMFSEKPSNL